MRRVMGLVAVSVLVLSGCGSRVDGELVVWEGAPAPGNVAVGRPGSEQTAPKPDRSPRNKGMVKEIAEVTSEPTPPTTARPQFVGKRQNDGKSPTRKNIITSVAPECVERPGQVVITIETVPFADAAYAAVFADGGHHGQWGLSRTDVEGRLLWTIPIGAGIPDGRATVAVSAIHPQNGGGSGQGEFRVAGLGDC